MAVSSAPGKVYLFGEHAVVYGEPAIPCAIDRRARVEVTRREGSTLRIDSKDISRETVTLDLSSNDIEPATGASSDETVRSACAYIRQAIEAVLRQSVKSEPMGFDIRVDSDIPVGAGLGSSAALVVGTIHATARELDIELDHETIADLAYRVEYDVQDGQASRADTFCSTNGGAVRVEGDSRGRLSSPDIPLVVGFDGHAGETGKLVAGVRRLRSELPPAADAVEAIGSVVRTGESAVTSGDLETIGTLMDINHGLLSAIGVSSRSLDAMVWAARDGGALGAKLTGAGGNGCIVALDPQGGVKAALKDDPACSLAFETAVADAGVITVE